jgi:serine/threonine protein kinase
MKPEQWRRIEKLYNQAIELEESERAAFLRDACANDDGLRHELEALLAGEPQVASFLEKPALREIAPDFAVDESGLPAPGTKIGSYRVETPIAAGGMGTVYRAQDTKLNRPVAIKFLSDDLADAGARRRFQQEARMASALNHPHILTVHDAGEFCGRQYIVTEFVDGGTLTDWARAEKRTWRQIVELMTGVADGLVAAHEAGILHRDIKPANILVARNGYAKLADFGLAKLADNMHVDQTGTLTEGRTKPGMIIGTIAYMSPEQCSGKNLDGRSDIFSFGTVLYELLSGRRPFEGATDLEILKTIIHGEPPPLSGEIPPELRIVVEKALEKNPEERYQSAREFLLDLKRAQRLKTSEAPAYRPKEKPRWIRGQWGWSSSGSLSPAVWGSLIG